jgi:hypothetical protein
LSVSVFYPVPDKGLEPRRLSLRLQFGHFQKITQQNFRLEGAEGLSVGLQHLILVQIPEERWKLGERRLMVRTEHRLEAYATLAFPTVERSPKVTPGAVAVHLE